MEQDTDDEPGKIAHDYLFEPTSETKAHRAKRIDEALDGIESARAARRFAGYVIAAIAATATVIVNLQVFLEWLKRL